MNINTSDIDTIQTMIKEGKDEGAIKSAIFDLNKKAGYNPEYDPKMKVIISELAMTKGALTELGGMDAVKAKLALAKKYEDENLSAAEKLSKAEQEKTALQAELSKRDVSLKEYNDTLTATINNELLGIPDEQRDKMKSLIANIPVTKQLEMIREIKQMAKINTVTGDPSTPFGQKENDLSLKGKDPEKWKVMFNEWVVRRGYPEEQVKQYFLGKIPSLPTKPM